MESSTRRPLKIFGATMLEDWRCTDSEGHPVAPALGRRLHGKAYGLTGYVDGTAIKTNPVARNRGRDVSFVNGMTIKVGTPDPKYREDIDRQESEAGRAAVNWNNPFADRPAESMPPLLDLLEESEAPSSAAPTTTASVTTAPAATTGAKSSTGILSLLAAPFRRLAAMLPNRNGKSSRKTTAKPRSRPTSKTKAGASK